MQATTMVRLFRTAMDDRNDTAPEAADPREARATGGLGASELDALDAAAERLGAVDFGGLHGIVLRAVAVLA